MTNAKEKVPQVVQKLKWWQSKVWVLLLFKKIEKSSFGKKCFFINFINLITGRWGSWPSSWSCQSSWKLSWQDILCRQKNHSRDFRSQRFCPPKLNLGTWRQPEQDWGCWSARAQPRLRLSWGVARSRLSPMMLLDRSEAPYKSAQESFFPWGGPKMY